ncbi:MAG: hypothetical protein GC202_05450 [Alphaproteobacteria bacterium]|nr:hypothetical protein [Alphaproteobacteria bacterium]
MWDIVGTDGADTLVGTAGDDTISGGGGADFLIGSGGNDFYFVDDEGDLVFEEVGGGYDTVSSSISYAMADNVESLVLTGGESLWADGNELGNYILGNAANNDIEGYGGNDTIDGGGGWDVAYYGGNFEEYDFAVLPDGSFQISQRNGGADGTDSLISVESVSFANNYFDVAVLSNFVLTNTAPVALDDAATIDENGTIILDVLANDHDDDWTPGELYVAAATLASGQGTVSIVSGKVVYAAGDAYDHLAVGQAETVQIAYTVNDQYGGSSVATATLTIVGSNDAPIVHDKAYQVSADVALIANVLADTGGGADIDPDGDALHVAAGSYATAHGGTVTVDDAGNFVYVAASGYTGADSFNYTVDDGNGASVTGTVIVDVLRAGAPDPNSGNVNVVVTPSPLGLPEINVTAQFSGSQDGAFTTGLRDGRYVVGWTDNTVGNSGTWFQIYAANGVKIGDPIHAGSAHGGTDGSLVELVDGTFMVAWCARSAPDTTHRIEIYGRHYDANGIALGSDFLVNNSIGGTDKSDPSIAALAGGGFAVTWTTGSIPYSGVACRLFGAGGAPAGSEFPIAQIAGGNGFSSRVIGLADGSYYITWAAASSPLASQDVFGRHFGADGTPLSDQLKLNTDTNPLLRQQEPEITQLRDGGFVVSWQDEAIESHDWGIACRRFDASGNPVSPVFQINTTFVGYQLHPDIASLEGGGFVVTWMSADANGYGIFAQRYDAAGHQVGAEFRVNTYQIDDQVNPSVTGLENGGFVVAWSSLKPNHLEWSVHSQQFDANGERLSAPEAYAGTAILLDVATDYVADATHVLTFHIAGLPIGATLSAGTHDAANVWTVTEGDLAGLKLLPPGDFVGDVHLSIAAILTNTSDGTSSVSTQNVDFEIRDPLGIYGQSAADTLVGGSGSDHLYGGGGADLLTGNGGADSLSGGAGDDTLAGGAGNDTLAGGEGSDHFQFGPSSGNDVVADFHGGAGGDMIDLVGTNIHTFTQAQAAMTQQGADVVLDLGGGNHVQFLNTLLADFDASRFNYS